jgi:hypothetical protein
LPKRRVLVFNPGRWARSRTPVNLSVTHHRQNPLDPHCLYVAYVTALPLECQRTPSDSATDVFVFPIPQVQHPHALHPVLLCHDYINLSGDQKCRIVATDGHINIPASVQL